MKPLADRIMELEIFVANLDKTVEDLNTEVLRQSKIIDALKRQVKILMDTSNESPVRPLSEETPPPHY